MSQKLYSYLAGNIKKGKEEEKDQARTEADRQTLRDTLPDRTLVFLDPASRSDDLSFFVLFLPLRLP